MRRIVNGAAAAVVLATLFVAPGAVAHDSGEACGMALLSLFEEPEAAWFEQLPPVQYVAREGSSGHFMLRLSHACQPTQVTVAYRVDPSTPAAAEQPVQTGEVPISSSGDPMGVTDKPEFVPIVADDEPETVDQLTVTVDPDVVSEQTVKLGPPHTALIHVLDDDGTSRASFAATSFSVSENKGSIQIPVFRMGDVSQADTSTWTLRSGSATAGEDAIGGGTVSFPAGEYHATLTVAITGDSTVEGDETFMVDLGEDPGFASTTASVTIVDDEESVPPRTSFHHPRHGHVYDQDGYAMRQPHTWASDTGGAGLAEVHLALRRKMEGGGCRWWDGGSFAPGPCSAKTWLGMFDLEYKDAQGRYLWGYDLPKLRPTQGTDIRSYTAWTRAADAAGNLETTFATGRNRNTFKVAP